MDQHVAIIGAGIIGTAAAFHLADRGFTVSLVSNEVPGATAAAAGMLSPSFELGHDAAAGTLARMLAQSLDPWDEFATRVSQDPYRDFGYRRDGVYGIGYHAVPRGAKPVVGSNPLPAFAKVPKAFHPDEGLVDPWRLRDALLSRCRALGVKVVTGEAAFFNGQWTVDIEPLKADQVVLTAGSVDPLGNASLSGVRGRALEYEVAGNPLEIVPNVVRSPTVYFCPRQDGRLYIGATEEWPGAISAGIDELKRDAERLLPDLVDGRLIRVVEGFRGFIDRRGPFIGRDTEFPNVLRAQGHHRNGVLLAPFTALALERLLLDPGLDRVTEI